MRFFVLLLFISLSSGILHADDTLRVVILHDTVGATIDSAEKATYHLFPFWSKEEFHHAEIIMNADSSFTLVGTMKNGSIRKLPCSKQEFKQHRYLVCYYSGQVPPPDSLWPVLIQIVVRGTVDAISEGY